MKLFELITEVDQVRPNQYDNDQKTKWISEIEGMIIDEILNMAEGNAIEFSNYQYATDAEKELILPDRFCDIYMHYLKAKIEFYDEESSTYNNEVISYQNAYNQYAAWYRRNHMPKQPAKIDIWR